MSNRRVSSFSRLLRLLMAVAIAAMVIPIGPAQGLAAPAPFALSASPSPVGVPKGTLLAARPTAAPAAASNVSVTLTNNSGSTRTVKVEVVADAAAKTHVQAWLMDSTGTWYNSIVDGFGPANGFSVPDGYTGTNDFYVMGDQVGTYSATLNLRDAGTGELLATTSITAVVAAATYTLTYTAGANGTITGTSPQTVNSGGSGTLVTATPNAGYHFVSWSDGVLTAARTNSNVTGNVTVTATFAITPVTYTLTYTAGANGTITGTSHKTVNSGGYGTLVTATPNDGYKFVSWSDGVLTAARTNSNVTGNVTVTATFAINQNLMPVWRFYNMRNGSHFYTADPAEMARVQATLSSIYRLEGVAYNVNTANPANSSPLYRFYNVVTGAHFYTADTTERDRLINTMAAVYHFDGPAYNVCLTNVAGCTTVWRFFDVVTGTHFYTADAAEKANVIATLGAIYHLDGPALS